MIELVGLAGRETSFPNQLSGGQQQRVGIARSLAVGPGLWFLDEPFSALDPLIRRQMQDEFLRLQKALQKTIIFITHDIQEAFRLADRIAIMRQGEIIQLGKPSEILRSPPTTTSRNSSKTSRWYVRSMPAIRRGKRHRWRPAHGDRCPECHGGGLLAKLAGGTTGFLRRRRGWQRLGLDRAQIGAGRARPRPRASH